MEIILFGANSFPASFSADLLCKFSCFMSIVIIVHLNISDCLLVGKECILGILCVGTVEEANEGLYFSWCMSLLAVAYLALLPPGRSPIYRPF